jgi:probable HAF family extracellular repeat protein
MTAIAVGVCAGGAARGDQNYQATWVTPTYPSRANAINDAGMIVGTSTTAANPGAFIYQNGAFTDISHAAPASMFALLRTADVVNAAGWVAGTGEHQIGSSNETAYLYNAGTVTDLGAKFTPAGIDTVGDVAGTGNNGQVDRGLLYNHATGTVTDIGDLGGGWTGINGMNAAGAIVGVSKTADGHVHAFVYADGKLTDLGVPPGGFTDSAANGINDAGQIVGDVRFTDQTTHAALWDQGTFTDLGTFGNNKYPDAFQINNQGMILGNTNAGPILRFPSGDTEALSAHVLFPPPSPGADPYLQPQMAMNNVGEFVGRATYVGGNDWAVLLEPTSLPVPEPACATATFAAAWALLAQRRRGRTNA